MVPIRELVILVSRLTGPEPDFFPSWGVQAPTDPPHIVYIGEDGRPCSEAGAVMWLVRGDGGSKCHLPARAVEVARGASVFLLIHTGGNNPLQDALRDFYDCWNQVSEEILAAWDEMAQSAFQLSGIGGLYRGFILSELADYAKRRRAAEFSAALAFLRAALGRALELHPGDAEGENRADATAKYVADPDMRAAAKLPRPVAPAPPRNPIAAVIHDRLTRFYALCLDFQVAADDREHWAAVKENYKGKFGPELKGLRRFITGEGATQIECLPLIAARIRESIEANEEDRTLLGNAESHLPSLLNAGSGDYGGALALISQIDEGTKSEVTAEDFDILSVWLSYVRRELSALDNLYKKCCGPRPADA